MRSQDIPSEVLNVEDKVFASLSVKQAVLVAIPIGVGLGLLLFPPALSWAAYKTFIVLEVGFISCLLAVRLQGKLFCQWLLIMRRFYARPRRYITKRARLK